MAMGCLFAFRATFEPSHNLAPRRRPPPLRVDRRSATSRQRMLRNLANAVLSKCLFSHTFPSLLDLRQPLFQPRDFTHAQIVQHFSFAFQRIFFIPRCKRTRNQSSLFGTKRNASTENKVQTCKHQVDSKLAMIVCSVETGHSGPQREADDRHSIR